jgi:predicted enzyme related to lactoylglutathione lyase
VLLSELDRLDPVARLGADVEPRPLEQRAEVEPDDRLVLGDEDPHARESRIAPVERVQGIGGVFLRARDPERLRAWYAEHLGFELEDYGGALLMAAAGDQTVWAIFPGDTDYWPPGQQVMVNYRVRELDAALERLRAAGAEVDDRVEEHEYGRFGWAFDPEGNRFELWQPPR